MTRNIPVIDKLLVVTMETNTIEHNFYYNYCICFLMQIVVHSLLYIYMHLNFYSFFLLDLCLYLMDHMQWMKLILFGDHVK